MSVVWRNMFREMITREIRKFDKEVDADFIRMSTIVTRQAEETMKRRVSERENHSLSSRIQSRGRKPHANKRETSRT
jgi:hypothetical protein